jgi:two-component system NarL family sensor kinase
VQCGVVLVAMLVAGHRPILLLILLLPALPIFVAARATDRAEMLAARSDGLGGEEQADLEQRRAAVLRTVELQLARLAADLHDGPVQLFRGLVGQIQTVKASIAAGDPDAARLLQEVEERVTAESASLRVLVAELRPPVMQRLGLAGALAHLAQQFQATGGIECTFQTTMDPGGVDRLSEELEVMLYRVTQEALTNVVNHADASHVHIALTGDDGDRGVVCLEVHDDGGGFDVDAVADDGHYGLALMRRWVELAGGALRLDSTPGGGGTTITVEIKPDLS